MLFLNLIQANLKTKILGKSIEYFPYTNSTNDDIWNFVNEGESLEGLVVVTDDQRGGRGRRENKWHSSPGNSLTFSFLLKPELDLDKLGFFSLLAAVSVCEGIKKITGINCKIKWPNDILVDGEKIAGVLIENREINEKRFMCIGIGINVNENLEQLHSEIISKSTSLFIKLEKTVQREQLLAQILNSFENYYPKNMNRVRISWLEFCDHLNQEVKFYFGDELVKGKFNTINQNGYAEVKINGENCVYTGGIIEF